MKIADVSEQYNISADTLRSYERVGLIESPEQYIRENLGVNKPNS